MRELHSYIIKHKILFCILVIIFILILQNHFVYTTSSKYKNMQVLLNNDKKIEKYIKTRNKIDEVEILTVKGDRVYRENQGVEQEIQILGNGNIYILKNKEYAFAIEYGNLCAQKKYNGTVNIFEGKCKNDFYPEKVADKIINNSNEMELRRDDEQTGYDELKEFSSKFYFSGKNPNNYIIFSNSCFRIVNIAQNNTIKIVYEGEKNEIYDNCVSSSTPISGSIALYAWDKTRKETGNWRTQSWLKDEMEDWVKDELIDVKQYKLELNTSQLENAKWFIGEVGYNDNLKEDILDERKEEYTSKIGLLNPSDYMKISCATTSVSNSKEICGDDNYLHKENYNWWTINSVMSPEKKTWLVMNTGNVSDRDIVYSYEYYFSGVRPVFYLDNDIMLFGLGTENSPYEVIN